MLQEGRAYTAWSPARGAPGSRTVIYEHTLQKGKRRGFHVVRLFCPYTGEWTRRVVVPPDTIQDHRPVDREVAA